MRTRNVGRAAAAGKLAVLGGLITLAAVTPYEPSVANAAPATVSAASIPDVTVAIPDGVRAPVQEDDPRWDCRTMGNRVCGRPLPPWFGWERATWATTREVCGKHSRRRAVVVWAKNLDNDNSMVVCANGKFSDAS